ncbi:MscL family protein [Candidatus Uhrbacteria bacterium]|nr:MscL family protein [Candidatus Uhrbacteria bacterium]
METQPQTPGGPLRGFLDFIRERGVVGLAVGFIIGGAVTKTVTSLVDDVINPLIGTFAGSSLKLSEMTVGVIKVGSFANNLINLFIISVVVYFVLYKALRLDKLEKPKT